MAVQLFSFSSAQPSLVHLLLLLLTVLCCGKKYPRSLANIYSTLPVIIQKVPARLIGLDGVQPCSESNIKFGDNIDEPEESVPCRKIEGTTSGDRYYFFLGFKRLCTWNCLSWGNDAWHALEQHRRYGTGVLSGTFPRQVEIPY